MPFLRTLDSSVAAVNQGGRRKGAACVYLEPWHPDVEEFLELRDNTGEDARRAHNLNLANWVPDEFMRRVEADEPWSLIDPDQAPELPDLWGEAFEAAYRRAEEEGRIVRQVPARELYAKMMRTLAQTGNGWMTFKDAANRTCNQTCDPCGIAGWPGRPSLQPVHRDHRGLQRRRDRRLQPRLDQPGRHLTLVEERGTSVSKPGVDWEKLRETVRTALPLLDRVIDVNFYPSDEAAASNPRWRPVGLGLMGLQDVFFALGLPFDSDEARALSTQISEEIYLTALEVSCELAQRHGAHPAYDETRAARGVLQPDHWPVPVGRSSDGRRSARRSQNTACATRC